MIKPSSSDADVDNKSSSYSGEYIRIGSWNLRSFCSYQQRKDIVDYLKSCPVDIVAVQETRLAGLGSLLLDGYVLHYYGEVAGHAGVGLLIKDELNHHIKSVTQIDNSNGRIMVVNLQNMTIIVVYAPTECSYSIEEKEKFYEILENTVGLCHKKIPIYICGDFNARIGSNLHNVIGKFTNIREIMANENGVLLKSFAVENHFRFQHSFNNSKQAKKSTWKCNAGKTNNYYATLDHILTPNRFKNDNMTCKTFGKFNLTLSDHRLLILKVKRRSLKFKKAPRPFIPPMYWSADCIDGIGKYVDDHKNEILFDENDVNNSWLSLSQVITDGIKVTPKFAENNDVFIHGENSSHFTLDKWWEKKVELIENEFKKHNLRKGYQYLKSSYTKRIRLPKTSAEIAKKVMLEEIILPNFELTTVPNKNDIMNNIPTITEMNGVIKRMHNGRACGLDKIPGEIYKNEVISKKLYDLIIIIWEQRHIPDIWRKSFLVPVPKKDPGEFRGINLLCSAYKIYAKIILNRIMDTIIGFVGTNQNGFLPGRSTSDVIGCMRRLVSANIKYGSNLHGILIDFSKAFDRVSRIAINRILLNIGIDYRMVERIMDLLSFTTAVIGKDDPIEFEVKDGVRQGCPIGPILFVMVLGFLMWSIKLKYDKFNDFEYADDLTIVGDSMELLNKIFDEIVKNGPELGLIVNVKKTDFLHIDGGVMSKGVKLLGTSIDDNWNNVIKKNMEKARNVYLFNINRIWKIEISLKTKIRVFQAICIPVLLYGLESLPLTEARLRKLDSCIYKMLKSIMGYKFDNNVSYLEINTRLEEIGISFNWPSYSLSERMDKDFWHFFRHHPEYANICNEENRKSVSRKFTLDQVICKKEGIKVTDLNILIRYPELTRKSNDNTNGMKGIVDGIIQREKDEQKVKLEEYQAGARQRLREFNENLEREKQDKKRKAEELKNNIILEKQLKKRKLACLKENKTVFQLLGFENEYFVELNKLNNC